LFRVQTSCWDWLLCFCVEYYWFRRTPQELGNGTYATDVQETRGRIFYCGLTSKRGIKLLSGNV
jgi:hypothetical protein